VAVDPNAKYPAQAAGSLVLVGLIEQTKTDLGRLLTHFRINSLADMDLAQFKQAVTLLESKIK
jgi:hypothetical protein